MRWVWLPLTAIGIAMIVWGVRLDPSQGGPRHKIIEQQAKALCTACIGLTVE